MAAYKTRFYFPHDANELTDCECTFLAGAPAREGAFGLWGADRCGDCWLQKKKPLEGALSTSALLQPLPGKRWTDPDHNFRSLRRPNSAELTTAASGNASQFARRGKTKLACLLKGPSV